MLLVREQTKNLALKCFTSYATFSGRARRKEFWTWTEFCFAIQFELLVALIGFHMTFFGLWLFKDLIALFSEDASRTITALHSIANQLFIIVSCLFQLAVIVPSISVCVRRLHDTDKSGWWYWILLVPFVGWIALLVFCCTEGTKGPNRFGPDPKSGETEP